MEIEYKGDIVVVFLAPNDRKTRLELKPFEVNMLYLLAVHKHLTNKQLLGFHHYHQKTSSGALRKKLWKWNFWDVVQKDFFEYGNKSKGNGECYYAIGKRGVRILIELGFLDSTWEEKNIKEFMNVKNISHRFGSLETVIRALTSEWSRNSNIESLDPTEYVYFPKGYVSETDNTDTENKAVIPDWILKVGNRHINIEYDNATETSTIIHEKIFNYIEYCNENPEEDHIVVFIVADETNPTRDIVKNNGPKRLFNMKEKCFRFKKLYNSNSNLSVYVVSLTRAHRLIIELLTDTKPYDIHEELGITQLFLDPNKSSFLESVDDYRTTIIEKSEVFIRDVMDKFQSSQVIRFSNKAGTYHQNVVILSMEEGNIKTLERLKHLVSIMRDDESYIRIDKVIALYSTQAEWENDIIGLKGLDNVLFGDIASWMDNSKPDIFYKLISPFKKGVTTFD